MRRIRSFKRRSLSMTSLIDVIFLLLLFFMLSSTFSKFGEIDLVTSSGGGAKAANQKPPVFVKRDSDTLSVNGTIFSLEETILRIKELNEEGSSVVILSIGESVTSQLLLETMVSITKAAPVKLTLVQ